MGAAFGQLVQAAVWSGIGAGDTQLIGPLVPSEVNRWNQRLGQEDYERMLGVRPKVALVNEMAWSQGMVGHYVDAGYDAVLMEWNNPALTHPEWDNELRFRPARTRGPGGTKSMSCGSIRGRSRSSSAWSAKRSTWTSTAPGCKVSEGKKTARCSSTPTDAEIFDFRPGASIPSPPKCSTVRVGAHRPGARGGARRWSALHHAERGSPSGRERARVRATLQCGGPHSGQETAQVHVTRWALSGRDDVRINSACHARARHLRSSGGGSEQWRQLCGCGAATSEPI